MKTISDQNKMIELAGIPEKLAAPVYPVDAALAELRAKCDAAAQAVAAKYGARLLGASPYKGKSEIGYQVGMHWE